MPNSESASASFTRRIEELADWRGETLAHVRQLIHEADPEVVEEWKWAKASSPGLRLVYEGGICTGRDLQAGRQADLLSRSLPR